MRFALPHAHLPVLAITTLCLVACVPPRTDSLSSSRAKVSAREFAGVYCNASSSARELPGNRYPSATGMTLWELLTGEKAKAGYVELVASDTHLSARLHEEGRTVEAKIEFDPRASSLALPRRSKLFGHHYVFWSSAPERITLWLHRNGRLLVTRDVGGVTFLLMIPMMAASQAGQLHEFERGPDCTQPVDDS